jgi:hypothetical protein
VKKNVSPPQLSLFLRNTLNRHPGAIFYYLVLLLICVLYASRDLFSTSEALVSAVLAAHLAFLGLALWISFGRANTLFRIAMTPLLMLCLAIPLSLIVVQWQADEIEDYPARLLGFLGMFLIFLPSFAIHGIPSRKIIIENNSSHARSTIWSLALLSLSIFGLLLLLVHTYHDLIPLNDTWIRYTLGQWEGGPDRRIGSSHSLQPYGLVLLFPFVQTLIFTPMIFRTIFLKRRITAHGTGGVLAHKKSGFDRLGLALFYGGTVSFTTYFLRNHFSMFHSGFVDEIVGLIVSAFIFLVYLQVGISFLKGRLRQWFQQTNLKQGISHLVGLPFFPLRLCLFLISPPLKREKQYIDSPWCQALFVLLIIATVTCSLSYSTTTRLLSANIAFTKISPSAFPLSTPSHSFSNWDVSEERLVESFKATDVWGTPLKHSLRSVFLTFSKYSLNVLHSLEDRHGIRELTLDFAETSNVNMPAIKLNTVHKLYCLNANASIQIGDLSQMKNLQKIYFSNCAQLDFEELKLYKLPSLDFVSIHGICAVTGNLVPEFETNSSKISQIQIAIYPDSSTQTNDIDLQQFSLNKLKNLESLSLSGWSHLSGDLSSLEDSPLMHLGVSLDANAIRNQAFINSIPLPSALESIALNVDHYDRNNRPASLLHDSLLHLTKFENLKELTLHRVELNDFSFLQQFPPDTVVHLGRQELLMPFLDTSHELSLRLTSFPAWSWGDIRDNEVNASNRLARILINNPTLEFDGWNLRELASQAASRGIVLDDWELTEGQRQKLKEATKETRLDFLVPSQSNIMAPEPMEIPGDSRGR